MTFINPTIELTFTEDSSTYTISEEYIIKQSIKISEQWLKGLDSSSNFVELQLNQDCPIILSNGICLLSTDSDVKAVLYNDSVPIFTGYISESLTWTVTNSGKKALAITIEDVGTRLLPKPFIRTGGKVVLEDEADVVIRQICNACGVPVDSGFPVISTNVLKVVEIGATCQSLLNSLFKEIGYAYYFTELGKLSARKIECNITQNVPVLNKDDLYSYDGSCITLQKQIRQYRSSKVNYKTIGKRRETLIYKDISGQDEHHPDCNILLTSGQTYPDPNGYPSYVEAKDLVNGNQVVYISNVVSDVEVGPTGVNVQSSISQFGADTISVLLNCVSTAGHDNAVVSKLQASANLTYIEADNDTIAGTVVSSDVSDNVVEMKCEWIHDKTPADNLANLLVNYYEKCNKTYQFYASVNYDCGTIVKIVDDVYSNLSQDVLITAKDYGDYSNVIRYTAVSIKEFEVLGTTNTRIYDSPSAINVTTPVGVTLFDLNLTPGVYKRNGRKIGNQLINVSVTIAGYDETSAAVTVDNGSFSSSSSVKTTTINAGQTVTLYIPYNNTYEDINVRAVLNQQTEVRKVISVVDETVKWLYLGALNSLPTPSDYGYDLFIPGDHFLCISNFVDADLNSYTAGDCYAWTGGEWQPVSSTFTDIDGNNLGEDFYATAIMNCVNDAVDANINDSSQLGSWMKKLAANEIVANTIMAKRLVMTSTGSIESTQYTEEGSGYPTSGYKLTSSDGTLRAMNAYLRDVNIKCTDSTSAILLQTQRYQAGDQNIPVKDSSQAARWCIDDLASTLTESTQTACTYASNSRYVCKPSTQRYEHGYRYLISSVLLTGGGREDHGIRHGASIYTAPANGWYHFIVPNYPNVTYPSIIKPDGSVHQFDAGTAELDVEMEIGDKVCISDCYNNAPASTYSYRVYYDHDGLDLEISAYQSITANYNESERWWQGAPQDLPSTTCTGYSYVPEVFVKSGSALSSSMVCGSFDSSNYLNMYCLSSWIASLAPGLYNCDPRTGHESNVTIGATTLVPTTIGVSNVGITFTNANFQSLSVSIPIVTTPIASTGWAKLLNGTINLAGQSSAIVTHNVVPDSDNSCTLGEAGKAWKRVISYAFDGVSTKEAKTNIEDYKDNALDIINDTNIISFNYKGDETNRPKIGFIAEETNSLLSTPEQNKFDLYNAVGLLMKAVQELCIRLNKLENK